METVALAAPPQLLLTTPHGKRRLVTLAGRRALIGRRPDNDIVLDSELVSRHHAALVREGRVVTLTDLASRNGTFVNGRKVEKHVLANRDVIEIGDCVLRFLAFE
jgi:pSer/pThr/pTyr-binding forkhead associated (FHA) protein